MPNKPIPISAATSRRSKARNYTNPTKADAGSQMGLFGDITPPKAPKLKSRRHFLGTEGRREWNRITKLMASAKVIGELDRTVLTQYCQLWEQFLEEPKEFTAAQHTQLRLCAVELGLTPSARSRLRKE